MRIIDTDYEFSGFSSLSLERSVRVLFGTGLGMGISKVEVVLHDDERIRAAKPESLLSTEYERVKRVEFGIEIESVPTRIHIRLYRENSAADSGTIVGGMLDLRQVVSETDEPVVALQRLATAVTRIAELLHVAFLVVADEDDAFLQVQPGDLRLPSLFGVYERSLVDEILDSLPTLGGLVEATPDPSYRLIWVAAPSSLVSGDVTTAAVLELLRRQLMTNPIPWSPLCRRFL